jgi:hypothetical protein
MGHLRRMFAWNVCETSVKTYCGGTCHNRHDNWARGCSATGHGVCWSARVSKQCLQRAVLSTLHTQYMHVVSTPCQDLVGRICAHTPGNNAASGLKVVPPQCLFCVPPYACTLLVCACWLCQVRYQNTAHHWAVKCCLSGDLLTPSCLLCCQYFKSCNKAQTWN